MRKKGIENERSEEMKEKGEGDGNE